MARLDEQHLARAALTYLAEPGDPALGALLEVCEPAEVLAAIKAGTLPGPGPGCDDSPARRRALEAALGRWRIRRTWPPASGSLTAIERCLDRGQISARGVVKVIRVAWTLADLAGQSRPGKDECNAALGLWLGVQR